MNVYLESPLEGWDNMVLQDAMYSFICVQDADEDVLEIFASSSEEARLINTMAIAYGVAVRIMAPSETTEHIPHTHHLAQ